MTASAKTALATMLEAHGGDSWRAFQQVSCTIVTGGTLWSLKGTPIEPIPRRVFSTFSPQWTVLCPFGEPDWTMTWTPEEVQVTAADGTAVAERRGGRAHFDRSSGGKWDAMNLAYFNGYAMWTYLATPFVFSEPGYEFNDASPVELDGDRLRGVEVTFPEHVHTHSRRQRFYVDAEGLLRRHDYEVDVWASMTASHILSEYVEVQGLKFPTRRRVFPRRLDGSFDVSKCLVSIDLSEYALR